MHVCKCKMAFSALLWIFLPSHVFPPLLWFSFLLYIFCGRFLSIFCKNPFSCRRLETNLLLNYLLLVFYSIMQRIFLRFGCSVLFLCLEFSLIFSVLQFSLLFLIFSSTKNTGKARSCYRHCFFVMWELL